MPDLPSFLVVGCAKAGTTSLYWALKDHPSVFMASVKESYFLLEEQGVLGQGKGYSEPHLVTSLEEYENLFEGAEKNLLAGEICNAYLYFHEEAIPKTKRVLGDPKIVIVLREPVSRTYSGYLHLIRMNLVRESLRACLDAEPERIKRNWWWGYHIRQISLYAASVEAYLNNFSNVAIFHYEDMNASPEAFLQKLARFLEIPDWEGNVFKERHNLTGVPRNKFMADLLRRPSAAKKIWQFVLPARFRRKLSRRLWDALLKKPSLESTFHRELKSYFSEDLRELEKLVPGTLKKWKYDEV